MTWKFLTIYISLFPPINEDLHVIQDSKLIKYIVEQT